MVTLLTLSLLACRPASIADKDSTSGQEQEQEQEQEADSGSSNWWEYDDSEDTSSSDSDSNSDNDTAKPEDEDDTGKPDDWSESDDCGNDFNPNASCSGTWETTMCYHQGLLYWCENGEWINEEDKPD